MKVKVIKDYLDVEANVAFKVDDKINVENKENSDFYHIWEKKYGKERLIIIPKVNCVVIK